MAARTYQVVNGAQSTTAATPKIATGTAIKTLLQIQAGVGGLRVIEWGISLDAAASTPLQAELLTTGAVFATVTAFVATDVVKMNGPNDVASGITLGTAASGYNSTAEGTIAAARTGDYQLVSQSYLKQFPLGREFEVAAATALRVRVTAAATVNASCYIVFEE